MKKRFSFAVFAAIAGVALWSCGDISGTADWSWDRESGGSGIILTAYNGDKSGVITLPLTVYGWNVVGVEGGSDGTGIFINTPNITGVVIPEGFSFIGDRAFSDNQLNRAEIGNSVASIGNDAFYNNQLSILTIGNSVTAIGNRAFMGNLLASVMIPQSVVSIGTNAFAGNQLTTVIIGANVSLSATGNSFPSGFDAYYTNTGKRAGVYTRPSANSTVWAYSANT